jgi:hypothetical protein
MRRTLHIFKPEYAAYSRNTRARSSGSVYQRGMTIDASGTVSIRGGFAFEAAYEFEGIDYTTRNATL